MLIFDLHAIGGKLYAKRRERGMTQAELAEKAEISDRTYADIERGVTVMRIDTLLKICKALNITPDEIFTESVECEMSEEEIADMLRICSSKEKKTAVRLLSAYLDSLR